MANSFMKNFLNKMGSSSSGPTGRSSRFFLKRWKPPESGHWVQFIPARYVNPATGETSEFFEQPEAQLKKVLPGGKIIYPTVACTCHNGALDVPCAVHDYLRVANQVPAASLPYEDLRLTPAFYASVIRLGYFHEVDVPYTRKDGSTATGKEIRACTSNNAEGSSACPFCKAGAPRHFGEVQYLRAGYGYMESFVRVMHKVESHCICGGTLYPVRALCDNCGAELATLESLPEEDRDTLWKTKLVCPQCGEESIPSLQYACTSCSNPTPQDFFRAAVKIGYTSSGNFRTLSLEAYGGPVEDFVLSTFGEEALERLLQLQQEPLDFEHAVVPTYDQQLNTLGIDRSFFDVKGPNPLDG